MSAFYFCCVWAIVSALLFAVTHQIAFVVVTLSMLLLANRARRTL